MNLSQLQPSNMLRQDDRLHRQDLYSEMLQTVTSYVAFMVVVGIAGMKEKIFFLNNRFVNITSSANKKKRINKLLYIWFLDPKGNNIDQVSRKSILGRLTKIF